MNTQISRLAVAGLVLVALAPSAVEVSLRLAEDVELERAERSLLCASAIVEAALHPRQLREQPLQVDRHPAPLARSVQRPAVHTDPHATIPA